MAFIRKGLAAAALIAALGGCQTTQDAAAPEPAGAYAGKSVLDAAIEAAGGAEALGKVKQLEWSGTATVTAGGKTTKIDVFTMVQPEARLARTVSRETGAALNTSRVLQVERGRAFSMQRNSWTEMLPEQAKNEVQQYGLYTLMLLAPLKAADAKVAEQPKGADGTRAVQASLPHGEAAELEFDASARLVRAGMVVASPTPGQPDIVQVVKFSGEIVSNGVKWPKHITIEQNGAPFYDMEITKFEALPATRPVALPQTLDVNDKPPPAGPPRSGDPQ